MTITLMDSEYMSMHEWLLSLKTIKIALEIANELSLPYQAPNWSLSYDYYNNYGFEADQIGLHVISNLFQYDLKQELEYGEKIDADTLQLIQELKLESKISEENEVIGRLYIFDSTYNFSISHFEHDGDEGHPYRSFDYSELYFFKNYMVLAMDEYSFNPVEVVTSIAHKFKEEGYGMEDHNTVSA